MPTGDQPTHEPPSPRPPRASQAQGTAGRRPGRPRALPIEEQRRLVIDAARVVFAGEGYSGATIERVARQAGTARSSVYELFDGKEDLFIAVVADAAERFVQRLTTSFRESADYELRDYVAHNFTTVFELFEQDRETVTVLLNAERGGMEPPMLAVADTRRRVLATVAASTRSRWENLGVDVGAASEMLSLMFFGLAEGVAIRQANDPTWDRDALIHVLTEFTVGGIYRLGRQPEVLEAAGRKKAPEPEPEST
jgi:AcrR family transcriptional regulator